MENNDGIALDNSKIKQEIKGDNNSITIKSGLSIDDVYSLAKRLFDENFPILQDVAISIVEQRVKEFLDALKEQFLNDGFENFLCFAKPDTQYSLYEAMREYSKYGGGDLLSLLVDLVFKRVKNESNLRLKISVDEAINLAARLSSKDLNYLSLTFLSKQVKIGRLTGSNETDVCNFFNEMARLMPINGNEHPYLNSLNCFVINLGKPTEVIEKTYSLKKGSLTGKVDQTYEKLPHDYALSYQAIVLAIANLKKIRPDTDFDLSIWIK